MRFNNMFSLYNILLNTNKNQWNIKWFIAVSSVGEATDFSMFLPSSISFTGRENISYSKFIKKRAFKLDEGAVKHNAV